MADDVWTVGIFYQADNGDWYEIKKTRLLDRLDNDPVFEKVLTRAGAQHPNKAFALRSDGTASADDGFSYMDGIDGS
jgi:hypothetical protein